MTQLSPVSNRVRPLLGTFVGISLRGESALREEVASRIFSEGFRQIEKVHKLMSYFDADSDIGRLNRARSGAWTSIDGWTTEVLKSALYFHEISRGAFDIGYLNRNRAIPVFELRQEENLARRLCDAPIDLGGVAKGFAVDKAIEAIKFMAGRLGILAEGVVNAGGDLRFFRPRGKTAAGQKILVRIPVQNEFLSQEIEPLADAVATSTHDGKTATVFAPTAMTADALTKIVIWGSSAVAQECLINSNAWARVS